MGRRGRGRVHRVIGVSRISTRSTGSTRSRPRRSDRRAAHRCVHPRVDRVWKFHLLPPPHATSPRPFRSSLGSIPASIQPFGIHLHYSIRSTSRPGLLNRLCIVYRGWVMALLYGDAPQNVGVNTRAPSYNHSSYFFFTRKLMAPCCKGSIFLFYCKRKSKKRLRVRAPPGPGYRL